MESRELTHLQLFCGMGGLSAGFHDAQLEHRTGLRGTWRCLGAFDSDPATIRAYNSYNGCDHGRVVDFFDRDQYRDFWGHEPPADWREVVPSDLREWTQGRTPDCIASSPPCRGFSGLLSENKSKSRRYQALNGLAYRSLWLCLEAFQDDPVPFFVLENVPRIATRGRQWLDELQALFRSYGYSTSEDTHDCGEIGGLAQHRRRLLLVARHTQKIVPFLYRPEIRALRTVGDLLEQLPVPGDPEVGPIHEPRNMAWSTAVRLALIRPGRDWRDLRRLEVEDGIVQDYVIHRGTEPLPIVDPVPPRQTGEYGQWGVHSWNETSHTITSSPTPGQGWFSIEDPRPSGPRMNNVFRLVPWRGNSAAITAGAGPSSGGLAVEDPRSPWMLRRENSSDWKAGGHYGVVAWDSPSHTVRAQSAPDGGPFSCEDPRLPELTEQRCWVVLSPKGAWHRPFTTAECAALQGLLTPEDLLQSSSATWLCRADAPDTKLRQWIGNAVPRPAARAIAEVIGRCLLANAAGEGFQLSADPIWARHRRLAALCSLESVS